jgi:hypothetical protein
MEDVNLEKQPDNKLTLFTMGLRMDVQPYWLVKGMISKNSQDILDEMISSKFRNLLKEFNEWQMGIIEALGDSDDPDREFVKHKRDVHIKQIQDIADFSKNLLELHSDWEAVATEEDTRIMEMAYEYWGYNKFYGHEQ